MLNTIETLFGVRLWNVMDKNIYFSSYINFDNK